MRVINVAAPLVGNEQLPIKRIHGLYAITPDGIPFAALKTSVAEALRGGARVLQFRCKSLSGAERLQQGLRLREMCRESATTFIVNDDVRLAGDLDADGVHLGREDGSLQAARKILGPQKIIGISCYNQFALAEIAESGGADYIAFGGFFPSLTKPSAARADPSLIAKARQRFSLPIVAIGGITLENAPQLIAVGADAIAVITDLFGAANIAARADAYKRLFENHVRQKQAAI